MKICHSDVNNERYIGAVVQQHVVPDVPYISDAATYSPESCFFGLFTNIGAFLLAIIIYVRHIQIVLANSLYSSIDQQCVIFSYRSLIFGLGSCLGICIVANFQETNVRLVHYLGAMLCFGFGTVYFWYQSIISLRIMAVFGSLTKVYVRFTLSVICTVMFFVVATTGLISHIQFIGNNPRKWYPSDGGWAFHVASTVSEWIVATIFCLYILSFTEEFKQISIDHPQLNFIQIEEE